MKMLVFAVLSFTQIARAGVYQSGFRNRSITSTMEKGICEDLNGQWQGQCKFLSNGKEYSYSSNIQLKQDDCSYISVYRIEDKESESYQLGRNNLAISFESGSFSNATAYTRWIEDGKTFEIREFLNYEITFESKRVTKDMKAVSRISWIDSSNISISREESSDTSSGSATNCIFKKH